MNPIMRNLPPSSTPSIEPNGLMNLPGKKKKNIVDSSNPTPESRNTNSLSICVCRCSHYTPPVFLCAFFVTSSLPPLPPTSPMFAPITSLHFMLFFLFLFCFLLETLVLVSTPEDALHYTTHLYVIPRHSRHGFSLSVSTINQKERWVLYTKKKKKMPPEG